MDISTLLFPSNVPASAAAAAGQAPVDPAGFGADHPPRSIVLPGSRARNGVEIDMSLRGIRIARILTQDLQFDIHLKTEA